MNAIWSPEAIADLAALRAYIAQDDPAAAQRVALHIIRNVETLLPNSPEMGRMISTFRDDWLRAFFVDDVHSQNIPPDLESRLFRKLQMLDDATTDRTCACRQATISRSCAVD